LSKKIIGEAAGKEAAKQAPDVHASEAQAVSGSEVDPAAEEIPST
jgi:hypothetical protein